MYKDRIVIHIANKSVEKYFILIYAVLHYYFVAESCLSLHEFP